MTLTVWRNTDKVLYRLSLNLGCLLFFVCLFYSMLGLMGLGKENHRGKMPFSVIPYQRSMQSIPLITVDINFYHLDDLVFSCLSTVKLLFFSPFVYCTFWKEVTLCSLCLRKRDVVLESGMCTSRQNKCECDRYKYRTDTGLLHWWLKYFRYLFSVM